MCMLRNGSKGGFKPGLSQLRVQHSTAASRIKSKVFRKPEKQQIIINNLGCSYKIIVLYPLRWTIRTCPFQNQPNFSWKYSAMSYED